MDGHSGLTASFGSLDLIQESDPFKVVKRINRKQDGKVVFHLLLVCIQSVSKKKKKL